MRQEHPFPGSNGPLPPVATHLPEAASLNGSLQPQPVSTQEEEGREVGHVKWRVYRIYVGAVGPLLTTIIVVSLLLMQVFLNYVCKNFKHSDQGESLINEKGPDCS